LRSDLLFAFNSLNDEAPQHLDPPRSISIPIPRLSVLPDFSKPAPALSPKRVISVENVWRKSRSTSGTANTALVNLKLILVSPARETCGVTFRSSSSDIH